MVAGEAALLFGEPEPDTGPGEGRAAADRPAADPEPQSCPGRRRHRRRGCRDAGAVEAGAAHAPRVVPGHRWLGSLEASRGGEHVLDPMNGVELSGEVDALGSPWNPGAWTAAQNTGTTWVNGDLERPHLDRDDVAGREGAGGALDGCVVERSSVGGPRVVGRPVAGAQLARRRLGGAQLARGLLGGPQLAGVVLR